MDPNTTLRDMLKRAHAIINCSPDEYATESFCFADELAELVINLDGWLSHGGFLPDAWKTSGRQ